MNEIRHFKQVRCKQDCLYNKFVIKRSIKRNVFAKVTTHNLKSFFGERGE